jgi:3-dehydroquinate dehydratase
LVRSGDGHLVAAISTTTGVAIADPFQRTAEIVDMLRLRLSQLNTRPTFRHACAVAAASATAQSS